MPMRPQDNPRDPWEYIRRVERENHETHADFDKRVSMLEMQMSANQQEHGIIFTQIKENYSTANGKLDLLLAEYHQSSGARRLAMWIPTLMTTLVSGIAIYTFITRASI